MLRVLFTRDLSLVWMQNLGLLVAYTLVGALLPLSIRQAGYPDSMNGLILGTGSLGLVVSLILTGRLIDQGDPRRYIAVGALLWAITSALLALFDAIGVIILCRFSQGFAYALFYTASLVYATRRAPEALRGTVVGVIEAVGALAIAAAPFLAFPLQAAWGYPLVFWLAACLSGVVFFSVGLQAPLPSLPTEDIKGLPTRLFSTQALLPGLVATSLFCVAVAYVNLAPLIAQQVGVASISLYMGLRALGTVPTRLLSGYIADQHGPIWLVVPGFLASMLAILLLPFIGHPGWAYLVPLLFGLGMGSASPALTAWMLKSTPPGERAVAVNTFTLLTEGSGFLGSWLVGAFLQSGSLMGFIGLAALLGLGLAVFLWVQKTQPVYVGGR